MRNNIHGNLYNVFTEVQSTVIVHIKYFYHHGLKQHEPKYAYTKKYILQISLWPYILQILSAVLYTDMLTCDFDL